MTQVASNSHRVEIVSAGTSALATLAASMSSGQWSNFTMGGLTPDLLHGNSTAGTQSYVVYTGRGLWDSVAKKIYYLGFGHNPTGNTQAGKFISWDDASNQWTQLAVYDTNIVFNTGESHTYMMVAINPANHNLYWRNYATNTIRKFTGISGTNDWHNDWGTGFVADKPSGANQINGALEWYPELNGGAGGLAFFDTFGAYWTNAALSSWSNEFDSQGGTISWSGDYDQNVARAGGYLYFGGGTCAGSTCTSNSYDLKFYRMNSTGHVDQMANLPRSVSQNADIANAVLLPHPNGTDLLILPMAPGGTIYKYTAATNSWATNGTTAFTEGILHLPTVIPEYGVIVIITHGGTQTTAYAQVYKP